MAQDPEPDTSAPGPAASRVAVIDLGSNSVRLVVFEGGVRTPVPVFNEKVVCGLGRGVPTSGRLNAEGVELALRSLARFVGLARLMDVGCFEVLATAAVREAEDGPDFAAEIERRFGLEVRVLSGEEESRLAALGVVGGLPSADGVMGDLGGGSLDLVMLNRGSIGDLVSLPLGPLWLSEAADGDRARARRIIDEALSSMSWLDEGRGRTFFPVGGAWRTLARISIDQSGHPLHILDGYTLGRRQATDLVGVLAGLGRKTLEGIPGVSSRRLDTLPMAALLLERLLKRVGPERVTFSAYGMREGRYFQTLPPGVRAEEPLVSACADLARRHSRFAVAGEELMAWTAPLFPGEDADRARLRLAACHLSDIAWAEHPDYRATMAYERVLRLPFAGMSHGERVALALSVCFGYDRNPRIEDAARVLLDEDGREWARIVGLALRLARALSGGVPDLLKRTCLDPGAGQLALVLPDGGVFESDVIERRLQALARALGVKGVVARERDETRAHPV